MTPDERITRPFLMEVETQCKFAMIGYADTASAQQRLQQPETFDPTDSLRVFYSVQAFLSASANISKLIWPDTRQTKLETEEDAQRRRIRGKQLRSAIGMTHLPKIRELKSKALRNYFEHFDERLDKWTATSRGGVLMNRCSGTPGSFKIEGTIPVEYMGYLDLSTGEVTFQDLKVSLLTMYAAVQHLYGRINQINQLAYMVKPTPPDAPTKEEIP